ncbi:hypothetical protein [Spirosoma jeollabukense]
MPTRQAIYLLALLVFTPFLALGQNIANSGSTTSRIDLSDKTFILGEKGKVSKTENDFNLYLIFHKDGRATFRGKRGNMITKDSPLSWRFVGDSLYLQPSSIAVEAEGNTQLIDREPTKFAIVKAPSGYILKEKDDQMLWIELK